MTQNTEFNWQNFYNMVDDMSCKNPELQLSPLEKVLLKCYWYGMNHRDILKVLNRQRVELNFYYTDDYFRLGLEPNVMRKVSKIIEKPITKKNFREIAQRKWEEIIKQKP